LRMKKMITLGYHSVEESPHEVGAKLYCVRADNFKKQMEFIKALSIKESNKTGEILITFDDGDVTNYKYAYPVLEEYALKAYFFIIAGFIGTKGYMSLEQIKELRGKGHIIGSHGMTHRILTTLSPGVLDFELKESKKILEEGLGEKVLNLSIPRAFYNKQILKAAYDLGYEKVFISDLNDFRHKEVTALGRILVKNNWDIEYFKLVIQQGIPVRVRFKEGMLSAAKRVLGAKRYDTIRAKLLSAK